MRIDEVYSRNVPDGEEHDPLSQVAIGAFIEVHREWGAGLTENMHEQAVCHELELRGIPYARQVPVLKDGIKRIVLSKK